MFGLDCVKCPVQITIVGPERLEAIAHARFGLQRLAMTEMQVWEPDENIR